MNSTILTLHELELARQIYFSLLGRPERSIGTMYLLQQLCPACGAPLEVSVDSSEGVPSETGAECLNCGAIPIFRLSWQPVVWVESLRSYERAENRVPERKARRLACRHFDVPYRQLYCGVCGKPFDACPQCHRNGDLCPECEQKNRDGTR